MVFRLQITQGEYSNNVPEEEMTPSTPSLLMPDDAIGSLPE